MNKKLKDSAIPVLNLPSASLYPMSTQTEVPKIEIIKDLTTRGVQHEVDVASAGVYAVIPSSSSASQTTKKLTDHTPRKRKLRKQVTSCTKKLKLIEDSKSTDVTREQFFQGCDKFLSPNLSKIVKAQTNLKPSSKSNRYSKEFKLFCLNLYYANPNAYNFLSKTLCSPSKRTLMKLTIPVGTKMSEHVKGFLARAIKHLSPYERECTLCMDEMSLKYSLFFDIRRDKIIGVHEIDDIQSPYAAGYAFTIMLRGIIGNWKQVIGYAFLTSSKIDQQLEEWIINMVKQLFDLGFNIRAIVSDQGSDFVKFANSKGISKETPYFDIDGRKIYYIFDVPHLIKCVRNNLMKYNFEFNGKIACWDDIHKCYQLDKQKDFRCAPKLTDSHLSPNNFQKQKVRLATQVLSNSVKAAVETYTKEGTLNPHDGTVDFIDTMNKLFDLLNSSNLFSPNPYNKPYENNELQRNLLSKAQNLLNNLKVRQKNTGKDITTTIKFIKAFLITINSIIHLYDDLKKESGFDEYYLFTRRLNNDCLENFFGVIRQAGGNCREPTCVQFERAFRKSFSCQITKLCSGSNCSDDFDSVLSEYGNFIENKCTVTHNEAVTHPMTHTSSMTFDIPEQNSFLYTCGYLLRRCVDEHKCLSMINYASNYSDQPTTNNLYLRERAYDTRRDSFGGLQVPPDDFVQYCSNLEAQLRQNYRSHVGNNISEKLFHVLSSVEFKSRPCSCFPHVFLIRLYIRMRLHYLIKFLNRELKSSKNKVSRKYLAVRHM